MINTKLMLLAVTALIGTAACFTAYSGAFTGLSSESGVCMTRDCCSDKPRDYAARYATVPEACLKHISVENGTVVCDDEGVATACCNGTGCEACKTDDCANAPAHTIPIDIGEAGCCKSK